MSHIFLSYCRDDARIMERVRGDLTRMGFNIWTDEGIPPGTSNWEKAIEKAIIESSAFVVLLSPSAKKSEWVIIEIHLAKNHGIEIIPVIIAGDERNAVPPLLTVTQWVDIRGRQDYIKGFRKLAHRLARYTGLTLENIIFDDCGRAFVNIPIDIDLNIPDLGKSDYKTLENGTTWSVAEVDLSGRIEDCQKPTVVTLSAGLPISLWLSGKEKSIIFERLIELKPNWSKTRTNVYVFATLVSFILKDHIEKLDRVIIDKEYTGHEGIIKDWLLRLLHQHSVNVTKEQIVFSRLREGSPAKSISTSVFRGKMRPDIEISASQVLGEFIKR